MRLVAYDPYVSADRARQLGVRARADGRGARRAVPTSSRSTCQDARHDRARSTPSCSRTPSPALRIVNAGRGGIVDEAALADAIRDGRIAGAAIDVFATEPTTESPLFELDNVVVTPHLGASTAEAQDKAGETIAEQVVLALRGEFVPFAVNVAATEAIETVRPFLPLAERLGRLFTGARRRRRSTRSRSRYEGEIADYDCRVLTLSVLKGVLGPRRRRAGVVRERAAARGGARASRCARRRRRRRATT